MAVFLSCLEAPGARGVVKFLLVERWRGKEEGREEGDEASAIVVNLAKHH